MTTKCLRCAKVIGPFDPYWRPSIGTLQAACSVECSDAAEVEASLRATSPEFEAASRPFARWQGG